MEWISVKDRMPDMLFSYVIVGRKGGRNMLAASLPAYFNGDEFISELYGKKYVFDSPTHWMPLPPPPETE